MTHKALLVGINDYAPVGPGGPDLRGCVNDVRDMAHSLNALGIVPAKGRTMRILTDERATRAAILGGFEWLVKGAKKGEVLIFHYSGHGSQVVEVGGDEADGRDETICPHDYATAGMITDDDFRVRLKGLAAGVNLEVFLDSCHSGTGTRELAALDAGSDEQTVVYRYIEPPVDWGYFIEANPTLPLRPILKPDAEETPGQLGTRETVVVPRMNHVLWAGCRNNQTSAEAAISGSFRGAFTYHYCQALRRAGVGITRRRLDSLVSADLAKNGYSQIPQLEGNGTALGQKVFT